MADTTGDPSPMPQQRRFKLPEGLNDLESYEIFWRDRFALFEAHGYLLRPRFRPGWVPSWVTNDVDAIKCEDFVSHSPQPVLDATRVSDGTRVAIKRIKADANELEFARFLAASDKLQDPRNHVASVLDDFADDKDPDIHYMVMPFLRPFNDPPFYAVSEVIDFMRQTLEGLDYIHKHNVAHRDCSNANIMMNGDALYPQGFHPGWLSRTPDNKRYAKVLRRRDVPRIQYYFVDFGISSRFAENETDRLVSGANGLDQDVPELKARRMYDPFAVDIFILGNLFKKEFTEKYENMSFLKSLTDVMTDSDPENRPKSEDALKRFEEIIKRKSGISLRWRLRLPGENRRLRLIRDIGSVFWEMKYWIKSLLSLLYTLTIAKLKRQTTYAQV